VGVGKDTTGQNGELEKEKEKEEEGTGRRRRGVKSEVTLLK